MLKLLLVHIVFAASVFASVEIALSLFSSSTSKSTPAATKETATQDTYMEISGTDLTAWSGRYHLDQSFDEKFWRFTRIDIAAGEGPQSDRVRDSSGVDWDIKSLVIRGESVAFQTMTRNGESYVFTGSFRLHSRCSVDILPAGMQGHLVKLQDGLVVAAMNGSFHRVYGC